MERGGPCSGVTAVSTRGGGHADRGTHRRWRDGRLRGALRTTERHHEPGEAGGVFSYSPESKTLLTP